MRVLAVVSPVGILCLASGFYLGSAAADRARLDGARPALQRAREAMTVGRRDEALEYVFAALDRDPELYPAYEVAGDAVSSGRRSELARHFYRAALSHTDASGRARIQAKIAALTE
jgi:Tfp pilus assembly protein PilF